LRGKALEEKGGKSAENNPMRFKTPEELQSRSWVDGIRFTRRRKRGGSARGLAR